MIDDAKTIYFLFLKTFLVAKKIRFFIFNENDNKDKSRDKGLILKLYLLSLLLFKPINYKLDMTYYYTLKDYS